MVTIKTTGSRVLDVISQIIVDKSLFNYDDYDIAERLSERFREEDFYVIDPMVEIKLKNYVTK